eukprot:9389154-Pyramimonas_sp.AAC.1
MMCYQSVRPPYMDEYEKLQADLQHLYLVYLERFRNLQVSSSSPHAIGPIRGYMPPPLTPSVRHEHLLVACLPSRVYTRPAAAPTSVPSLRGHVTPEGG